MNNFDEAFFKKYLTENTEIKAIIHEHITVILNKILINYFFWVIITSFIYYYSDKVKEFIPFFVLEIFLIWMFIKVLYDIFDWYNDVWIITNEWVVDFNWKLFSVNSISVKYQSIEWIEIIQEWVFDTFLWKWDLIIHKVWWWDEFILKNASLPYEAINEIEKFSKEHHHWHEEDDEEENEWDWGNYEIIVKALSWVIEDYLEKSWYKKENSKEKKEYIEKIKKKNWTIDLSE